jgi:hypothetical protein
VVVAALLIVAGKLGRHRPGGFVAWRWLDHGNVFVPVALCLLALACWLTVRDWMWRVALTVVPVLLAMYTALAIAHISAVYDLELTEFSRHPPPDGSKVLVLYRSTEVFYHDPTWELRLRSGSGLAEREWDLGCVNSDSSGLNDVEWTGPNRLRVEVLVHGRIDIVLDSSTGRPDKTVHEHC